MILVTINLKVIYKVFFNKLKMEILIDTIYEK